MTIDEGSNRAAVLAAGAGTGSPIGFRLEAQSGVPTYLQLVHQVERALRLGYLKVGDRLPTVKETVESLAINPNTVLKAYRELEHRGLAAGRPGQGTFIRGTLRQAGLTEQAALRKSMLSWLAEADGAGLDPEGMTALFASSLQDFLDRRGQQPGGRGARRAGTRAGEVA